MEGQPWREIVDESTLAAGLASIFDELVFSGWLARSRYGEYGLAFWPANRRRDQIAIDTRYPLIEPRLDGIRDHTGLALTGLAEAKEEEGGER